MTSRHLKSPDWSLPLLTLLLLALRAGAFDITKSADDFFHGGAMQYLANNIPAALDFVPGDRSVAFRCRLSVDESRRGSRLGANCLAE